MELKNKVVSGFLWTATERFSSSGIQVIVSIIFARLLEPSDFGVISILMFFSVVATAIIDSGFSQALIRKLKPTHADYTTVFYINIAIAVALYLILLLFIKPIATFYQSPILISIAPLLFLSLLLNAMGAIQHTVMTKQMNFKILASLSLASNLVSGAISIYMAYTGWGVWALVWQMLIANFLRNALYWVFNEWRPKGGFSGKSARELFGFGSKLFATSVINQVFTNISQLFIGRIYAPAQLGYYYQSQKLKDMVSLTVSQSVMNVSYPALSSLQQDDTKLKDATRKVIIVLSFVLFPAMAGLIATADELFALVLTDKWMPAVPYFKIFCLTGLLVPALNVCFNVMKVKCESGLILRLEIFKKLFAITAILVAVTISVKAVVWAQVIFLSFEALLNSIYTAKYIQYTLSEQIRDLMPYATLSLVMYLALLVVGSLCTLLPLMATLAIKIGVGAGLYIGISRLLKLEAWRDTTEIVAKLIGKS